VGLLELLAGAFVSVFQSRRRFMIVLEEISSAQRERDRKDVVQLSPKAIDELFCCIGLTAVTCIDMRLQPAPKLVASDASSVKEAAVMLASQQSLQRSFNVTGSRRACGIDFCNRHGLFCGREVC
jgi:hypothetical protein